MYGIVKVNDFRCEKFKFKRKFIRTHGLRLVGETTEKTLLLVKFWSFFRASPWKRFVEQKLFEFDNICSLRSKRENFLKEYWINFQSTKIVGNESEQRIFMAKRQFCHKSRFQIEKKKSRVNEEKMNFALPNRQQISCFGVLYFWNSWQNKSRSCFFFTHFKRFEAHRESSRCFIICFLAFFFFYFSSLLFLFFRSFVSPPRS